WYRETFARSDPSAGGGYRPGMVGSKYVTVTSATPAEAPLWSFRDAAARGGSRGFDVLLEGFESRGHLEEQPLRSQLVGEARCPDVIEDIRVQPSYPHDNAPPCNATLAFRQHL